MKKVLVLCMVAMMLLLVGCSDNNSSNSGKYKIDYNDATSFENDLNNGVKVNGKIVKFKVVEYKSESILGYNCWAGEHLNFISEEDLDVHKGDIIIGRVTEEASTVLGSWKINYEVLEIEKKSK
ncbi:MAG: hypothetical protein PUF50_00480 [Erysipelotrichaceae bacterium]|nr:hypothetical protein [Erysipelotrichaceae bacterium]